MLVRFPGHRGETGCVLLQAGLGLGLVQHILDFTPLHRCTFRCCDGQLCSDVVRVYRHAFELGRFVGVRSLFAEELELHTAALGMSLRFALGSDPGPAHYVNLADHASVVRVLQFMGASYGRILRYSDECVWLSARGSAQRALLGELGFDLCAQRRVSVSAVSQGERLWLFVTERASPVYTPWRHGAVLALQRLRCVRRAFRIESEVEDICDDLVLEACLCSDYSVVLH